MKEWARTVETIPIAKSKDLRNMPEVLKEHQGSQTGKRSVRRIWVRYDQDIAFMHETAKEKIKTILLQSWEEESVQADDFRFEAFPFTLRLEFYSQVESKQLWKSFNMIQFVFLMDPTDCCVENRLKAKGQ